MPFTWKLESGPALIFLPVLLLKVALLLFIIPHLAQSFPDLYQINQFSDDYDKIATNLLAGNGYRVFPETGETAMRLPGFVFFLAGMFKIFGQSLAAIQLANIALTCATAYLILRISSRIIPDKNIRYLAAISFMLYPGTILAESRIGVECLFTFLVTAFILLFYRALETNRIYFYLLTGFVLGASAIVKSTTLAFPAFIFAYLLLVEPNRGKINSAIKNTILIALPMLAVIAPWAIRNYLSSGEVVLGMTNFGSAVYQSLHVNRNFPSQTEHYQLLEEATDELSVLAAEKGLSFRDGFFQYFYTLEDEVRFDRFVADLVKKEYTESPVLFAKSCALNYFGFWFNGRTAMSTYINIAVVLPLIIFAALGIYSGIKRRLRLGPIFLAVGAFPVLHMPILGVSRYHIPLVPMLTILACTAIYAYLHQEKSSERV